MALINKLTAIANAIRNKTGKSDLLTLEQMPIEIEAIETGGGSAELPEEAFKFTQDCSQMFSNNKWKWFLDMYGNKLSTENLTNTSSMFNTNDVEALPFDFNFNGNSYYSATRMFAMCKKLKKLGKKMNKMYPSETSNMFQQCYLLRELPEFVDFNPSRLNTYNYASMGYMFNTCCSLRQIPETLLKQLFGKMTTASYTQFYYMFYYCHALDEIRGLNPQTGTLTSNAFQETFTACHRLKEMIFATQEDGTPYKVNWKNQTIDLCGSTNQNIGFGTKHNITSHNSGLDESTMMTADTYEALKDNPDSWTQSANYSRYNHDSAVNTINSLPDTSEYLATQSSGTNTIKFYGIAGAKTDGGAINTLTEEEIAVATAKGWTVSIS